MKIEEVESKIKEIWNDSKSINDISKYIYGYHNSRTSNRIKNIANSLKLDFNIIKENQRKNRSIYSLVEKICPVCKSVFIVKEGHKKEKDTCSYSCANKYFRTGINHGNWKVDTYRSTCFYYHKKECVICKENKIVEVHHFDENHKNNNPENLIPLCPTHHQYWHSGYKNLVYNKILEYQENFKHGNGL